MESQRHKRNQWEPESHSNYFWSPSSIMPDYDHPYLVWQVYLATVRQKHRFLLSFCGLAHWEALCVGPILFLTKFAGTFWDLFPFPRLENTSYWRVLRITITNQLDHISISAKSLWGCWVNTTWVSDFLFPYSSRWLHRSPKVLVLDFSFLKDAAPFSNDLWGEYKMTSVLVWK